jgi:hypothetical protein
MALSFRRRTPRRERIAPADPAGFGTVSARPVSAAGELPDDYHVGVESEAEGPPVAHQAIRFAQFLLIVAIAVLSLSVFWIIGLMIGIL